MKEQIITQKELEANKELYLKHLKKLNKALNQPITENDEVRTAVINNTLVINVRPK